MPFIQKSFEGGSRVYASEVNAKLLLKLFDACVKHVPSLYSYMELNFGRI